MAAFKFIVDILPKLTNEADFAEHIWPKISEKLHFKGDAAKIESLWLLLEINGHFKKVPTKAFLVEHFGRKKLLHEDLPKEIAQILMVRFV